MNEEFFNARDPFSDEKRAVQEQREKIKKDPDNVALYRELAELQSFVLSELDRYEEFLKEILAQFPADPELNLKMAAFLIVEERIEDAEPFLARLPGYDPDNPEFFVSLIEALMEREKLMPDNCFIYIKKALELDSCNPLIVDNFIDVLIKRKEFEAALLILSKYSLEGSYIYHVRSAICLLCLDRDQEAQAHVEKAKSSSSVAELYFYIAHELRRNQHHEKAIRYYDLAIENGDPEVNIIFKEGKKLAEESLKRNKRLPEEPTPPGSLN